MAKRRLSRKQVAHIRAVQARKAGLRHFGKQRGGFQPQEGGGSDSGSGGSDGGSGQSESGQPQEQEGQPQEQGQPQEGQPQEQQDGQPQEQPQEGQPQEGQPQEQPATVPAGHDVVFPFVSSHVKGDKLYTSAICLTPNDCSLVHCGTRGVPARQGPVNVGAERISNGLARVLSKHKTILTRKGLLEKQKSHTKEIIERARQGDQNAMAIIALVRDNSKKGMPRAQQSFRLMKEYIDDHPTTGIGDEFHSRKRRNDDDSPWQSTLLADGPPITSRKLGIIAGCFGEDEQYAFSHGFRHGKDAANIARLMHDMDDMQKKIFKLGQIMREARKIQNVRLPNSRISAFCCDIGWELGE